MSERASGYLRGVSALADFLQTPARQAATLEETGHRPWPLPPPERWLMGQTWHDLLFAHWGVPAEAVRAHVPDVLPVDTWDGMAWVGVTPFRLNGLRLRATPPPPILSSFLELNARTYVTIGGKPGIWFFSLDASSRFTVAAARRTYKLPYFHARMEGPPHYRCARSDAERPHVFEGSYRPVGRTFNADPGSLEHFLTERDCLYTTDESGTLQRAEIHHPPWPLQAAEAEVQLNTIPPDGLEVGGEPLLHYAARPDVLIWPLQPV
jgi:uncharacterized protein